MANRISFYLGNDNEKDKRDKMLVREIMKSLDCLNNWDKLDTGFSSYVAHTYPIINA